MVTLKEGEEPSVGARPGEHRLQQHSHVVIEVLFDRLSESLCDDMDLRHGQGLATRLNLGGAWPQPRVECEACSDSPILVGDGDRCHAAEGVTADNEPRQVKIGVGGEAKRLLGEVGCEQVIEKLGHLIDSDAELVLAQLKVLEGLIRPEYVFAIFLATVIA